MLTHSLQVDVSFGEDAPPVQSTTIHTSVPPRQSKHNIQYQKVPKCVGECVQEKTAVVPKALWRAACGLNDKSLMHDFCVFQSARKRSARLCCKNAILKCSLKSNADGTPASSVFNKLLAAS